MMPQDAQMYQPQADSTWNVQLYLEADYGLIQNLRISRQRLAARRAMNPESLLPLLSLPLFYHKSLCFTTL